MNQLIEGSLITPPWYVDLVIGVLFIVAIVAFAIGPFIRR